MAENPEKTKPKYRQFRERVISKCVPKKKFKFILERRYKPYPPHDKWEEWEVYKRFKNRTERDHFIYDKIDCNWYYSHRMQYRLIDE